MRMFSRWLGVMVAGALVPVASWSAQPTVYEGFNYVAGANLDGQTGGSNFAPSSSWTDDAAGTQSDMATIRSTGLQFSNLLVTGNSATDTTPNLGGGNLS